MRRLVAAALLAATAANAAATSEILTPEQHRRGAEQTFLTYPEWFLVHSPAEYAAYVKEHDPSGFPFFGHVGQFWQGYRAVYGATKKDYPFNFGYHVMVMVIGLSTTVEYAIRAVYEKLVGRVFEATRRGGFTPEDRFGAEVAQGYVDFIRVRPWYEYGFFTQLKRLWKETPLLGPDLLRKWERKYALTTEYLAKGIYGVVIAKATAIGYEPPLPLTAVVVDGLPAEAEGRVPFLKAESRTSDDTLVATVPRYEAFMESALAICKEGGHFREIAGNSGVILVTALVPRAWQPPRGDGAPRVLFTQPILTRPEQKRVALVVPVARLHEVLPTLDRPPETVLEHVYDY
jgi:hypothetical protein